MPKLVFAILEGDEDNVQSVNVLAGKEVVATIRTGFADAPEKVVVSSYSELMVDAEFETYKKAQAYVARSLKSLEEEQGVEKSGKPAKTPTAPKRDRKRREDAELAQGRIRLRLNAKQTALLDERAVGPSYVDDLRTAIAERHYYNHDFTSVIYVSPVIANEILRWSQEQEGAAFIAGSKALAKQIAARSPSAPEQAA